MATVYYDIYISDSTVLSGSQGRAGLTPTVAVLKTTGATPGTDVSGHATITEVGGGHYQVAYDPVLYGEAAGVIDGTASLTANSDRYLPVYLAKDSSTIASNLDAQVSTRSTYAGADTGGTTTLLSRVTAPVALASQIPANFTSATFASAGVFAPAALANVPAGGPPLTAPQIASAIWQDLLTSSDFTTSGSAGAALKASLGASGVTVATNNDKSGYSLASAGLDAIVIEPGVNIRQAQSPILAAACGLVSGAGSGVVVIKGGNTTTTRITATTDSSGNRNSVVLTLPT